MPTNTAAQALAAEAKKVFKRTWFKVYTHDVLGELRVTRLKDDVFRTYIELLALASNDVTPGAIIADIDEVASAIRRRKSVLLRALDVLETSDLIVRDDSAIYIPNPKRFYRGEGLNWSSSPEGNAIRQQAKRMRDAVKRAERNGDAARGKQCQISERGTTTTMDETGNVTNPHQASDAGLAHDVAFVTEKLPRHEEGVVDPSDPGLTDLETDREAERYSGFSLTP